jgi:hypothetical protein
MIPIEPSSEDWSRLAWFGSSVLVVAVKANKQKVGFLMRSSLDYLNKTLFRDDVSWWS